MPFISLENLQLTVQGIQIALKDVWNSVKNKANRSELVQSDYAQNDDSKLDYVKNRTHYEATEMVEVYNTTLSGFTFIDPLYQSHARVTFAPELGKTYTVVWDGMSYDVEWILGQTSGTLQEFYCGNANYRQLMTGGEPPFGLMILKSSSSSNILDIRTESAEESHTIAIYKAETVIHKIDEKFIPDTVARTSDVDAAIAGLVDTAPDTLNTLNELSAALGDDPNFATTVLEQVGNKVEKVDGMGLSSNDYTDAEQAKLGTIEQGATATNITIKSWTSADIA